MNDKKKVLITGGSGDIAQSIKKTLENEGFDVLAPTRQEMDVTDIASVKKTISSFIPDILINNAGFVKPQSVKTGYPALSKKHIDINLTGLFNCTETALAHNKTLDIVNIGSAAAVEVHATWSEYCATKAGVVMATQCWAEDGLYAVCISPGRTKTKMRKSLYPDEDQNTLLDPDDFAKVVLIAVQKKLETGSHIIVRKQTVDQIIEEYD